MTSVASAAAQLPAVSHADEMCAPGFLRIPSHLDGFMQTGEPKESVRTEEFGTSARRCSRPVQILTVPGRLAAREAPSCPCCRKAMEGNGQVPIALRHLPLGMERARVEVLRPRWACRECGTSSIEGVPFRAPGQRITLPLLTFVCDLLALDQTLKAVSLMAGLNRNVVKKIERARLSGLYTEGEGSRLKLRKPKRQARYLGADTFKLHNARRWATVIIDLKTGHVLWLAYTKRKQVVYDFCDFVGSEWMLYVEAIACDMNADFERAFLKRHPHLDIVYDYFHLIKNFNEKVICKVRKDEQARLKEESNAEAVRALKHSTYILMSGADTRKRKERDARAGKVVSRGSALFGKEEVLQKGGARKRYKELISQNELLAACDIVGEMLSRAYGYRQEKRMRDAMERIVEVCRGTKDRHFGWFARLVESHMDGIVAHARHHISSGKVEGTNQMIKTLRRAG
ncbi:ISL3 family transposase [Atopobium sp. oral taxon 416]|uniref:ISL3 family transposase n=1 Tax=Atopobium sp. oral taxon 416 TaxID=712157 RepID=UPI001BAE3302|nr:ISL3 family transposase [Atopobium sp. oral taxon 416]QUC02226.1 ISL3 family transposase [Atopobium sp. oral taxon 416]